MPTYYRYGALWIEIRSREPNHPMPHVHIHLGKYSVSVSLSGAVLAGNLHNTKMQAKAIKWVMDNRKFLEDEWRRIRNVQNI